MSDNERIKAQEPKTVSDTDRTDTAPAAAAEQENALDDDTAGDGVAFFEGGDGREAARDDIERSG